ncbi:MAG: methylmalonyl-CoA epimerase [Deltaproteobacteria bacterium]|nr:methylmalonyl-CoA epimerase [Deltaproteobacteria bacterium]MBN2674115.1 methylmalonyl-CoA epimerase [Deltaproteobacteria bacterium]
MSVKKISHVGVAVPNIEEYIKVFSDTLGMNFQGVEEVAEQKVKVAFLQVGESRIELLEPTSEDSPVHKYLNSNDNKPKFHHIAFEVDDLQEALDRAKADGLKLIDETPRRGAGGAQIAFLHPKSTAGVLTELCSHTHDEQLHK